MMNEFKGQSEYNPVLKSPSSITQSSDAKKERKSSHFEGKDSKQRRRKIIKIKLLCPKGSLKSTRVNSSKLESSMDLSLDDCDKSGDALKEAAEKNRKHMIKNRQAVVPIMGKTALLAKHGGWNSDAEIITKIVMEKFKNMLNRCKRHVVIAEDRAVNTLSKDKDQDEIAKSDSPLSKQNVNNYVDDQCYLEDKSSVSDNAKSLDMATSNESEEIEYDSQKFLEEALGSELDEDEYPSNNNVTRLDDTEDASSIDTAQVSYLLSKTSSMYATFSSKLKKNMKNQTSSPRYEAAAASNTPTECRAAMLLNETAVQHQIIVQTCKALNICTSLKGFKNSEEYIEAEKILLLAIRRHEALKKELLQIDYEEVNREELQFVGKVSISNLTFPAFPAETQTEKLCRWFLAILSCGISVEATEVVRASEDGSIKFQKCFSFENLDADFEITISIYSLKVKNDKKAISHESKFHIKEETATCPAPNSLFSKGSCTTSRKYYSYERRNPSFTLWGIGTVHISDLMRPTSVRLLGVPAESKLRGIVSAEIKSDLKIKLSLSGFVTVGKEAGGFVSWNRYWCSLQGYSLLFWNYPTDQGVSKPTYSIDLTECVSSRVLHADREFCARPRTLVLELGRPGTARDRDSLTMVCLDLYTVTRHYLSLDTQQEMSFWQRQLNTVVSALRNWNCTRTKMYITKAD